MLLIDEHLRPDGGTVRTHLDAVGPERIRIVGDDGVSGELSLGALDRVMHHYGRPLDPSVELAGPALAIGSVRIVHLRHHAIVDAEARDWLVWHAPGEEPLAALATTIAGALRYLVLRLAAERG